ncbi:MAG: hypothetical protein OXH04_08560, partial [Acidobacteria bacterium]|nr:hypothetical protein [Acidobacteriota bacterium]
MSSDTVPRATPGGTVGLPGTGRQPEAKRIVPLSLAAGFGVALAPALALVALAFSPRVHQNATLLGTFLGAACVLAAWNLLLVVASLRRRDPDRPRFGDLPGRGRLNLLVCCQDALVDF